jgi:hypothetical protein
MQNEKNNHLFYYHLPVDRMQQIMSFGWVAVWNGNLYTNNFDLNLSSDNLADKIAEIIAKTEKNRDDAFNAVAKNLGKKGDYSRTIDEIKNTYGGNNFASKSIDELKAHLIANKDVPESIKAALK